MLKSLALATMASLAYSQRFTGGNEPVDGHIFDMFYLQIDGEDYVQFDAKIPNDAWLALNIGGRSMTSGDDVIHFIAKGDDSEFVDSYLGGFFPFDDKE